MEMTEADKKAAEKFALESSSEPIPNFVIRIDEEDGANKSAYVLGRYRGYTAACAHKNAQVAELEAVAKASFELYDHLFVTGHAYPKSAYELVDNLRDALRALKKFEGVR
jgi:hypothetical protein